MAAELDLAYDPEMRALRDSTIDLIKSRPHEITLIRKGNFEKTAAGGQRRSAEAPTQKPVTRYFGGVVGGAVPIVNTNGQRVNASYVLIGDWTDDIRDGDEFELYNKTYMVIAIDDASRGYQTKAWVTQK